MSTDAGERTTDASKKIIKTAIACSVCRIKRQKCNGLRPRCGYCTQNDLECTYSDKRKKRGPPPGYLARIADRTRLLEYFIGYLAERESSSRGRKHIGEEVDQFLSEIRSKEKSDDEWTNWTNAFNRHCGRLTSAAVENLNVLVPDNNALKTGVKRARSVSVLDDNVESSEASDDKRRMEPQAPLSNIVSFDDPISSEVLRDDVKMQEILGRSEFNPNSSTQAFQSFGDYSYPSPRTAFSPLSTFNRSGQDSNAMVRSAFDDPSAYMDVGSSTRRKDSAVKPQTRVTFSDDVGDRAAELMQDDIAEPEDGMAEEMLLQQGGDGPSSAIDRQPYDLNYTSGFWRTADAEDLARSPRQVSSHTTPKIQLPPKDVQDHLIDIYLRHIHPQFPLLDQVQLRTYQRQKPNQQGSTEYSPPSRILMMALCAYSACFSPTLGGAASDVGALGVDNVAAGGILADIWYEEARSMLLTSTLRRRCGLDTVQAVVLMALREHGKGQDFQAWMLLGIAIRCGQDINMHIASRRPSRGSAQASRIALRKTLTWRCLCTLDLLLALQLGRPPAVTFCDKEAPICQLYDDLVPAHNMLETTSPVDREVAGIFDATHALSAIVSTIQQKLYLGGKPQSDDVEPIKKALDAWHERLPKTHVVSLGQRSSLSVVCLHLLHQTALLLLYRPFQSDSTIDAVSPVILATSTCKVLLDTLQDSLLGDATVSQCQPQVVYLIFTIAIGFLCILRELKRSPASFSKRLAAQGALLSCSEALDKMAHTWPLAKKYGRAVENLMEAEGLEALESRPSRRFSASSMAPRPVIRNDQTHLSNSVRSPESELSKGSATASLGLNANSTYTHTNHMFAQPGFQTMHDSFPSIDEIAGTTGWGTEDFAHFDFPEMTFDPPTHGIMDPDMQALLNFTTTPNQGFSLSHFGMEDSRDNQGGFMDIYSQIPLQQTQRGTEPTQGVESIPGHALDLLAHSALNR